MRPIESYVSIKRWFAWRGKPYAEGTRKLYLDYMENLYCALTGKDPDQLVSVQSREEADLQRGEIASKMQHKLGLSVTSIEYRIHALNQFYRANGIRVPDPYAGIERVDSQLFKDIKRSVKKE
jgi:hypothetical protein